jgi:hypothetical protein
VFFYYIIVVSFYWRSPPPQSKIVIPHIIIFLIIIHLIMRLRMLFVTAVTEGIGCLDLLLAHCCPASISWFRLFLVVVRWLIFWFAGGVRLHSRRLSLDWQCPKGRRTHQHQGRRRRRRRNNNAAQDQLLKHRVVKRQMAAMAGTHVQMMMGGLVFGNGLQSMIRRPATKMKMRMKLMIKSLTIMLSRLHDLMTALGQEDPSRLCCWLFIAARVTGVDVDFVVVVVAAIAAGHQHLPGVLYHGCCCCWTARHHTE